MKYVYRGESRGVPAEIAGTELARIRERDGRVEPQTVVNESRKETAPLHPVFTWDDTEAAEAHRRHEARMLIRAVRIEHDDTSTVPAYVNVQVNGERYYQDSAVAVSNPDEFDSATSILTRHLAGAQRAVADLDTLLRKQRGRRKQKRALREVAQTVDRALETTLELTS